MPRGSLRCFVSLCIVVLLGLFASFLDRVIHPSYISQSSPKRKVQQSQRSQLSDIEYRLFDRALVGETIRKSQEDNIWETQQLKQFLLTTATLQLNISQNGELESSHQRVEQSGEDNKSPEGLLDQGRKLQLFKKDWCQMQRSRLDWKGILSPCLKQTAWEEPNSHGIEQITDSSKCYITHWDIKQAGEFSRFFIQTVTTSNLTKTLGGDSWRIHLHGPSSLAPTVFDLRNGTYEVLFLIIEEGSYDVKIFLDYSLCHGLKDPPREWFKKGNSQGKNQPDGTLRGDRPYLISPFRDGEKVRFFVPPSKNSQQQVNALEAEVLSSGVHSHTCDSTCSSFLWDGFGRWVNGQWKPYIKGDAAKDERRREGTFISFGDSLSNTFLHSLSNGPYRDLCDSIFTSCRPVYHWVYDMQGYWGDGVKSPREPSPDNVDYQHQHVLSDIKKTLFSPEVSNKSVLLMNLGIHFVAAVNFTNYKHLIDDLIVAVNGARDKGLAVTSNYFKGRLIWKTTTALNRQRFPNPHKDVRRFLTFPRVELYNAYATSAMCRAGVDVIDVYPISNSYPGGTISNTDPVHYGDHVFREVEFLLHKMFRPRD